MNFQNFRPLQSHERDIIEKLLETSFTGRDELRAQLRDCQVKSIDVDGGLELKTPSGVARAPTQSRVPVEAETRDADGIIIHILLHVVDGLAQELEFFREDGAPVQKYPIGEDLDVFIAG